MNICLKALTVIWVVLFSLVVVPWKTAKAQGLVFSSFEQVQEKRTSLVLNGNAPLCLDKSFGISFRFTFFPDRPVYYGYVFRMINNHGQNIDLIYNHQNQKFSIVSGGTYVNLAFQVDSTLLFREWNSCLLKYEGQTLSLEINGKSSGRAQLDLQDHCFQIYFGACQLNNFKTSDLPPMKIKDIALYQQNKLSAYWPLREMNGEVATDSIGGKKALVSNPVWETPLHQQWQLVEAIMVKGNASYAFDPEREEIYMTGSDSIHRFLLRDHSLSSEAFSRPTFLARGFQSIYYSADHTLYSVHIDRKEIIGYQPSQKRWDKTIDSVDITAYWQSNKFINQREKALYILGGYGQLKYKNLVQRCLFGTRSWEEVTVQQQDYKPRYLAALGTKAGGDTAYILGGYGSDTGEQMLNPKYYYDLLLFDVKNKEIKKVYTLPEPAEPFVFASSMVIDTTDNSYYALVFPNDRFRSKLQLIKGSLDRPEFQIAADTIPYAFADNLSTTDLYYCARSNQLVAITQLTNKDKSTDIKIYTLAFPPQQLMLSTVKATTEKGRKSWLSIAFIILAIGAWAVVKYFVNAKIKRKKRINVGTSPLPEGIMKESDASVKLPEVSQEPEAEKQEEDPSTGKAVLKLFGELQVLDKDRNALTQLFSPLVKEMFLLIVIHTAKTGKGISTEKLYEILWHDKSERDARNNRSVNMVKLKGVLEKLGTGMIVREEGKWKFVYDPGLLWVDLEEFYALVREEKLNQHNLNSLLSIIKEDTFLFRTDYPWLEDIKSDVSSLALDVLLREITNLPVAATPDTYIEIANAIFVFDPIHEEALRWKCKNLKQLNRLTLAKSVYEKFCKDYLHIYGEPFVTSFQEIIS